MLGGGAGVQMHAIKMLKENRRLLKQKKADRFDLSGKNNFINAPDIRIKMSSDLYSSLNAIKKERVLKSKRIKRAITFTVIFMVACLSLGVFYFN